MFFETVPVIPVWCVPVPAHLETCSYADPFSEIVWRRITTPRGKAQFLLQPVTTQASTHTYSTGAAGSVAPAVHELYSRLDLVTIATRNLNKPLHTDCTLLHLLSNIALVLFSPVRCSRPRSPLPWIEKTAGMP
jgi:hypothetical protein